MSNIAITDELYYNLVITGKHNSCESYEQRESYEQSESLISNKQSELTDNTAESECLTDCIICM